MPTAKCLWVLKAAKTLEALLRVLQTITATVGFQDMNPVDGANRN
jgi:hypothetical protein